MKTLTSTLAAGLFGLAAVAFTAATASAAVVCNKDGDCWHAKDKLTYPAEAQLTVHDQDDWKWKNTDHFRWNEHDGRGYWKSGIWIQLGG